MADANNASYTRAEEIAALKKQIDEMQKRLDYLCAEEIAQEPNPYAPYVSEGFSCPAVRAKDHVIAGLLAIFLGMFGIHKFYLGYNVAGFIMLGVTVLGGLVTFGLSLSVVWLVGLIEGVIYLTKSQQDFERAYVAGKKEWF